MRVENPKLVVEPGAGRTGKLAMVAYQFQHLQCSLSVFYQKLFDPRTSGPETGHRERYWNLFHMLCQNSTMQAALDVCLHTQVPGLVSWTKASLLLAIDDTIDSLMKRIGRNGSDIKDITRLSVIFSTAKSTIYPGEYEDVMMEELTVYL
ncbi:uncharacterized protein K444DRAFT_309311 [Hyaloscypha bicolor E]|uniref:Uncharacterized protein n=1 Tax=Hyaloscypha bicolor E TaxID=1095630 RepID=A0A2J6TM77_9HELO|nr:uncharacterized protein K444DRAFT_309311 [Hyaloscypha bicolor E]PMD64130.1 hypothetical protein K444DRAFT_309311 [Hyaloscypha bicolor E]